MKGMENECPTTHDSTSILELDCNKGKCIKNNIE